MIVPRDYQNIAVEAVFRYFMDHTGNPLVIMPTGTGKSVVIAKFCYEVLNQYPDQRIIVATHVKELIEQNAKKILDVWPNAPIGIYSAGLKQKQNYMPITFAGVKSIAAVINDWPWCDLFMIDEAHLLSPDADTTYQMVIKALLAKNPFMKVIGLTATGYRMGQGMLTEDSVAPNGDHRPPLFTDVCIDMADLVSFNWFIDQGYLVNLIPKRTDIYVDVTGVHTSAGDYAQGELQTATEKVTWGALQEARELAADRQSWLVFAAGNENAEHASTFLNQMGITSTFVHSGIKPKDRDDRIQGYKDGYYRAICNNNILTTGFDDPKTDCIIMLRKTKSPGLWVQMLGRGTRPNPLPGYDMSTRDGRLTAIHFSAKPNCLVLDFARNTRDLGPINDPILPKRKGAGGGDAPTKICDHCGTYNHASVRFCIDCGAEFEFGVGFGKSSGMEELIASEVPVYEWYDVSTILYRKHIAKGTGNASLKVTYRCAIDRWQSKYFDEYVHFEAVNNFIRHKAHDWWKARHYSAPPATVDEALALQPELRKPRKIRVWTNRRFPEITNYEYE